MMTIRSIYSAHKIIIAISVIALLALLGYTRSPHQSSPNNEAEPPKSVVNSASQLHEDTHHQHTYKKPASPLRYVIPQVYRLQVDTGNTMRGGTSFLVSGQRVVATNYHVVQNGKAFWLTYRDQHQLNRRMPLRLLALYPQKDLALLETLDDLPGEALLLASKWPEAAEELFAIGFPAAADTASTSFTEQASNNDASYFIPSVLRGYVSRVLPNRRLTTQLQHQTPIVPGYSGGPLVNERGRVIAVSTSVHKNAQGISYGVLASDLMDLITTCNLPLAPDDAVVQTTSARMKAQLPPGAVNTHSQFLHRDFKHEHALLDRAKHLLQQGDIIAAQLICRHIASKHANSEAFLCLAKSYDPEFLARIGVSVPKSNITLSNSYYELAKHAAKASENTIPSLSDPKIDNAFPYCNDSICTRVGNEDNLTLSCEKRR
jgi:S1-C subfamily serine protease